jgi:hypothetical protein
MTFDLFRTFRTFTRTALPLAAVVAGLTLGACGDDPVVTPPAPRFAPVTMFNGNTSFDRVNFRGSNNLAVDTVPYGVARRGNALVSSATTINLEQEDGTKFGSVAPAVDTNKLVFVGAASAVSSGLAFSVDRPTTSATQAKVRLINISSNSGALDLHMNDAEGPSLASNISYNVASGFLTAPPTTTLLVVTKAATADTVVSLDVTNVLQSGKIYSVVVFGSSASNATKKMRAAIVEEP